MEQYGGHGRAISELKQHGLRAKTLDQNRNKIKESVQALLGDDLSERCGFEMLRQDEQVQSSYRLKISPKHIVIQNI